MEIHSITRLKPRQMRIRATYSLRIPAVSSSINSQAIPLNKRTHTPIDFEVTTQYRYNMATKLDGVVQQLTTVKLENKPTIIFVDDTTVVGQMVDSIDGESTGQPSIFIDLEGVNLCREGTVSIMQIYHVPTKCTYLIDVYTLQDKCFSTTGENGRTLKDILESETITKVFFDVRNDSDALYSHYKINLAGIQDLQLMELATRSSFSKRCISGLAKCIEYDAPLSRQERLEWGRTKEAGIQLFHPSRGGSYEIFNRRPLPDAVKSYCVQDAQILPRLWAHYNAKMTQPGREKVMAASKDRVKLSQSATYNGQGRHMALAPSGW